MESSNDEKAKSSASGLCIPCVRTCNRCPASFPWLHTGRCNTFPKSSCTNRLGVHIYGFSGFPFYFLLFLDQEGDPSLHLSCRGIRLLCRKEHIAIFVARTEMGRGRDSLAGEPDFYVFRCEQTVRELRVIYVFMRGGRFPASRQAQRRLLCLQTIPSSRTQSVVSEP